MSEASGTFFPSTRRKVELLDYDALLDAQDKKRFRLDLLMPLTNQPLLGAPEFIFEAYEKMDKKGSAIDEVDIGTVLEGITIEAFSTDNIQFPIEIDTLGLNLVDHPQQLGRTHAKFTAATLRNFKLVRVTRDKQSIVALKFSVTIKADLGMAMWAFTYHGGTFWALFTQAQPEIPSPPAEQMKLKPQEPAKSPLAGGKSNPTVAKAIDAANKNNAASIQKSRTQKESEAVAAGKPRGF